MTEDKLCIKVKAEPGKATVVSNNENYPIVLSPTGDSRASRTGNSIHMLTSTERGESAIEQLAEKIETRRANRIHVPFEIRKLFLTTCREIAKDEGCVNKISIPALYKLRDEYIAKVDAKGFAGNERWQATGKLFGYWDHDVAMVKLLEAACNWVEEVNDSWFFFRDFNYYNTAIAHRVRLFSSPVVAAIVYLFLFYLGSAILFCPIMKDDVVCPNRDTYEGWLTSVYFASVTMSTVGYGDVNLSGGERWRTFIGTAYMLVAMGVAYTVFSTAANAALSAIQLGQGTTILFRPFVKYINVDDVRLPLYQRVRRVAMLRLVELAVWFLLLNLLGVVVARYFVRTSDIETQQWDWMTTLYWGVQTTTTIGYGDLDMPFELRWFQIFFTTFGTAFVGAVFGAFAGLKDEVTDMRRFYAWKRREVSKRLIEEMQAGSDSDDKIDQFEFMVGSLLMLNKISKSDVEQIMDKYRELTGSKGYIVAEDAANDGEKKAARDELDTTSIEDEDIILEIDAPDGGL